jgi:hypothetical protein
MKLENYLVQFHRYEWYYHFDPEVIHDTIFEKLSKKSK